MLELLERLTTPHSPDRYLQLLDPTWSVRAVRARVLRVEHRTSSTVTLTLRPNRNFVGFGAGQHVLLGADVAGVRRTRCYSVASSQYSSTLELTARVEPAGQVSPVVARLRPGDVVDLSQAQGPFTLPAERPAAVLLISGGSGITPVLSMARTLADEGRASTVTFVHYARTPADVAYLDELDSLAARGVRVLRGYTRSGTGELDGYFAPHHLPSHDVPTWICGPIGLIDAVRSQWTDAAPLAVEHFAPPIVDVPAAATAATPAGRVTFAGSGIDVDGTTAPLLEQAENAGLAPEHGCRMGICFSCTRRLCAGTVMNTTTGDRIGPDNDIQICVTRPVGDVTVDL